MPAGEAPGRVGSATPSVPQGAVLGETLVEVKDLKVWFPITSGIVFERHIGDVQAVDGVSFSLAGARRSGSSASPVAARARQGER